MLDTLSSPAESFFLKERFKSNANDNRACPIILEIGTGSGVVLAFINAHAKEILERTDVLSIGTDINIFACHEASQTVQDARKEQANTAAIFADIINADLASPIRSGAVDILIFNPPYVPTETAPDLSKHSQYNERNKRSNMDSFDRDSHLLSLSYAGGLDGMEITNRLLDNLTDILHPSRGVAYVLLCAQNKPLEVQERMQRQYGLKAEIVSASGKQAGWEKLCILRLWRE